MSFRGIGLDIGLQALARGTGTEPAGQRSYRGSLGASFPDRDFPMYLRWHAEGKFPLDKLITRRYALEQINEACHDLHAGDILGRAILEY